MLTAEWKLEDALKIREEEGEKRGRIKGKLEGEQETTHKFVKQMYKGGFTVKQIVKVTELPEKDVKKILGLK
ncbi:MAG: hypothetical protein LBC59_01335 [Chitinispirillales bacterium]|nr:hypothetical protein [Chitinispirillales bacterium]